jgi:hypothetical protein
MLTVHFEMRQHEPNVDRKKAAESVLNLARSCYDEIGESRITLGPDHVFVCLDGEDRMGASIGLVSGAFESTDDLSARFACGWGRKSDFLKTLRGLELNQAAAAIETRGEPCLVILTHGTVCIGPIPAELQPRPAADTFN